MIQWMFLSHCFVFMIKLLLLPFMLVDEMRVALRLQFIKVHQCAAEGDRIDRPPPPPLPPDRLRRAIMLSLALWIFIFHYCTVFDGSPIEVLQVLNFEYAAEIRQPPLLRPPPEPDSCTCRLFVYTDSLVSDCDNNLWYSVFKLPLKEHYENGKLQCNLIQWWIDETNCYSVSYLDSECFSIATLTKWTGEILRDRKTWRYNAIPGTNNIISHFQQHSVATTLDPPLASNMSGWDKQQLLYGSFYVGFRSDLVVVDYTDVSGQHYWFHCPTNQRELPEHSHMPLFSSIAVIWHAITAEFGVSARRTRFCETWASSNELFALFWCHLLALCTHNPSSLVDTCVIDEGVVNLLQQSDDIHARINHARFHDTSSSTTLIINISVSIFTSRIHLARVILASTDTTTLPTVSNSDSVCRCLPVTTPSLNICIHHGNQDHSVFLSSPFDWSTYFYEAYPDGDLMRLVQRWLIHSLHYGLISLPLLDFYPYPWMYQYNDFNHEVLCAPVSSASVSKSTISTCRISPAYCIGRPRSSVNIQLVVCPLLPDEVCSTSYITVWWYHSFGIGTLKSYGTTCFRISMGAGHCILIILPSAIGEATTILFVSFFSPSVRKGINFADNLCLKGSLQLLWQRSKLLGKQPHYPRKTMLHIVHWQAAGASSWNASLRYSPVMPTLLRRSIVKAFGLYCHGLLRSPSQQDSELCTNTSSYQEFTFGEMQELLSALNGYKLATAAIILVESVSILEYVLIEELAMNNPHKPISLSWQFQTLYDFIKCFIPSTLPTSNDFMLCFPHGTFWCKRDGIVNCGTIALCYSMSCAHHPSLFVSDFLCISIFSIQREIFCINLHTLIRISSCFPRQDSTRFEPDSIAIYLVPFRLKSSICIWIDVSFATNVQHKVRCINFDGGVCSRGSTCFIWNQIIHFDAQLMFLCDLAISLACWIFADAVSWNACSGRSDWLYKSKTLQSPSYQANSVCRNTNLWFYEAVWPHLQCLLGVDTTAVHPSIVGLLIQSFVRSVFRKVHSFVWFDIHVAWCEAFDSSARSHSNMTHPNPYWLHSCHDSAVHYPISNSKFAIEVPSTDSSYSIQSDFFSSADDTAQFKFDVPPSQYRRQFHHTTITAVPPISSTTLCSPRGCPWGLLQCNAASPLLVFLIGNYGLTLQILWKTLVIQWFSLSTDVSEFSSYVYISTILFCTVEIPLVLQSLLRPIGKSQIHHCEVSFSCASVLSNLCHDIISFTVKGSVAFILWLSDKTLRLTCINFVAQFMTYLGVMAWDSNLWLLVIFVYSQIATAFRFQFIRDGVLPSIVQYGRIWIVMRISSRCLRDRINDKSSIGVGSSFILYVDNLTSRYSSCNLWRVVSLLFILRHRLPVTSNEEKDKFAAVTSLSLNRPLHLHGSLPPGQYYKLVHMSWLRREHCSACRMSARKLHKSTDVAGYISVGEDRIATFFWRVRPGFSTSRWYHRSILLPLQFEMKRLQQRIYFTKEFIHGTLSTFFERNGLSMFFLTYTSGWLSILLQLQINHVHLFSDFLAISPLITVSQFGAGKYDHHTNVSTTCLSSSDVCVFYLIIYLALSKGAFTSQTIPQHNIIDDSFSLAVLLGIKTHVIDLAHFPSTMGTSCNLIIVDCQGHISVQALSNFHCVNNCLLQREHCLVGHLSWTILTSKLPDISRIQECLCWANGDGFTISLQPVTTNTLMVHVRFKIRHGCPRVQFGQVWLSSTLGLVECLQLLTNLFQLDMPCNIECNMVFPYRSMTRKRSALILLTLTYRDLATLTYATSYFRCSPLRLIHCCCGPFIHIPPCMYCLCQDENEYCCLPLSYNIWQISPISSLRKHATRGCHLLNIYFVVQFEDLSSIFVSLQGVVRITLILLLLCCGVSSSITRGINASLCTYIASVTHRITASVVLSVDMASFYIVRSFQNINRYSETLERECEVRYWMPRWFYGNLTLGMFSSRIFGYLLSSPSASLRILPRCLLC